MSGILKVDKKRYYLAKQLVKTSEHPLSKTTLEIGGMKCAGCVAAVERQLKQESGVLKASVNLVTEIAVIEYSPALVQPETLAQKLTAQGFPSQPRSSRTSSQHKQQREEKEGKWNLGIAILLIVLSTIGHLEHLGGPHIAYLSSIGLHWSLATIALIGPSRSIILEGAKGLLRRSPNMNSLVTLGAVSAYITSCVAWLFPELGYQCFFEEPVMLLGFILLGRSLEKRARNRAKRSLSNLMSLQPNAANLVAAGSSLEETGIEIPIIQVKVGDWIRISPGEKIPVDGQIRVGTTTINEAMLTGESLPIIKSTGEKVVGGSLNQTGVILVQVERIGSETTLAQIVEAVETAQARKAPVQYLADKIAGYFTYGVMTIATVTFLFWLNWGGSINPDLVYMAHTGYSHTPEITPTPLLLSLKLAISVLVIACPCALGLATPTAILVGTSIAAERGLLIKGGDILEKLHQLKILVFDKTGTLTLGHPIITDYLTIEGKIDQQNLLQIAASAQSSTHHPLGISIKEAARQQNLPLSEVENVQREPDGRGLIAQIEGKSILVGNKVHLNNQAVQIPENLLEQSQSLLAEGKTLVYIASEGETIGAIALSDALRPDAQTTIKSLQNKGIEIVLVTGDQPEVAQKIAQELGILKVYAGITPQGKAEIIKSLQQSRQELVGMIGDGLNDAPALAQSDLGISLSGATDIAQDAAGVILMRQQLKDVLFALELSQATFRTIRQNLFFAFGYNLFFIPLAAGIALPVNGFYLGPAVAGAFMASSSVLVVLNSLLLNHWAKSLHP